MALRGRDPVALGGGWRHGRRTMAPFPRLLAALLAWFAATVSGHAAAATTPAPAEPAVNQLRITVLSTMLSGELRRGIGEWGFAALVEVNGERLLFDTGQRPHTVRENARELGVDLGAIREIILSHHHGDHIGGLLPLRQSVRDTHPAALATVHVAAGAFLSRGPGDYEGDDNPLIAVRRAYEASGGRFVEHAGPVQLRPGVWFTGPIPRVHADEQPVPAGWVRRGPDGTLIPDETPEDAALVFDTPRGLVVLTGCGHAGLVNTLAYARVITGRPTAPIHAVTGGFHLARASDGSLGWTAEQLRAFNVGHIHGAHCTGLEAVYRLRADLRLPRPAVAVASVGSWFDLATGIEPLSLAR